MEENNLILGRIPGGCGGIHKTYEESFIRIVEGKIIDCLRNGLNFKFYIDSSSNNELVILANLEKKSSASLKEAEIINIFASPISNSYNRERIDNEYYVEYIEKDILHRHLIDERMQVELFRRAIEEGSYGRK